jgi:methylmalonyl-CoA/ethylmalonyl-CoA epimerase
MLPSPTWTVDHIGIAVTDLDQAIAHYSALAHTSVLLREKLASQGVELAFLSTGGTKVELLAPLGEDSKIARFLQKRGPGLHHICYQVSDIEAELHRLTTLGLTLIDSTPRPGAFGSRIAFIAPQSCQGVLTELAEVTAQNAANLS